VLDAVADRNARIAVAARLIDGFNKVGELARLERVAERILPIVDHPDVRPMTRAWCRSGSRIRRIARAWTTTTRCRRGARDHAGARPGLSSR
jgi:hypothetical protein